MDKSEHPVVWRKIEDLTLWEDNPRKISKAELDPKYCARIIKRWEKLTGEKAEKVK